MWYGKYDHEVDCDSAQALPEQMRVDNYWASVAQMEKEHPGSTRLRADFACLSAETQAHILSIYPNFNKSEKST